MALTLTLIALVTAGISVAIALKTVRQERARSDARVAALAAAIDPAADDDVFALFASEEARPQAPRRHPATTLGIGVAVVAAVLLAAGVTAAMRTGRAPASAAVPATDSPLTLLSMRHERSASTLTVTGLVRNDAISRTDPLVAVVFAFDRAGDFVASARAPVDLGELSPGDESPFRVAIPNVPDVGRYRVSFRTESGLVRHLDRRAEGANSMRALTGPVTSS
jgi:hypothetical protein